MKYLETKERLKKEQQENAKLKAQLYKTKADLDYVAMETGVEIDEEEQEVTA